jgi:hypothetical protein
MRLAPEIRTHLDRTAIQAACRFVQTEPAISALTIALSQSTSFGPGELERFCAQLAEREGVELEILDAMP